jgi:hypothetical protein
MLGPRERLPLDFFAACSRGIILTSQLSPGVGLGSCGRGVATLGRGWLLDRYTTGGGLF